jgi:hypothetical protein
MAVIGEQHGLQIAEGVQSEAKLAGFELGRIEDVVDVPRAGAGPHELGGRDEVLWPRSAASSSNIHYNRSWR